MKLDSIRLLDAGDLAGQLSAIFRDVEEANSSAVLNEIVEFVVERLRTTGKADAKACIEVLAAVAERGCIRAKYHLAIGLLAFGDEGKDAAVAFDLLEQVIAGGAGEENAKVVMMALGNSGAMLATGVGCERNLSLSTERLLEASRRGCLEACFNAAVLMDPDVGLSELSDAQMATQLYRKAASGGSVQAAAAIAWKLLQRKVAEDFEGEGLHWLSQAAIGGHRASEIALMNSQQRAIAGQGRETVH